MTYPRTDEPAHVTVKAENVVTTILALRDAGLSRESILFIVEMLNWREPLQDALDDTHARAEVSA